MVAIFEYNFSTQPCQILFKGQKFLSCSAMLLVQLKRSKAWMHHRFFENSSSSRWLTSGKGGSRGRSQGRNLLFKNFKTVKLLGEDSWKNPFSSSGLLTLGKGGLRGRSQGRNCLFQNLDGLEITWGKELTRKSILHLHQGDSHRAKGYEEAGQRGEAGA